MNRKLSSLGAAWLGSCFAAACSASILPAGQDTTDGGTQEAGPREAGSVDSGDCCPASYDLYACTFSGGGSGFACHNPALGCASSTTCGQGCDPVVSGRCGGGVADACPGLGCFPNCPNGVLKDRSGCDTCQCAPVDGGPALQWYTTCGYPVCAAPVDGGPPDSGPACPSPGTPCTVAGDTCGTPSAANCGATLVCATQDPKTQFGGCPISSRQYKDGISYVNDDELRELRDEALAIRLATYKYKSVVDDPGPTHLGLIIEDNLQTPAVDRVHNRVDLYGYVSMVVAGLQVQEREIEDLRSELEATRSDLASCRGPRK